MSELINQLGVDWRLLLAQVVNFLLLFWLIKRFAFKPLGEFLNKRQRAIQKGLEDAQEAGQDREKLRALRGELRVKAEKEAETILQEARVKGIKEYDAIMAKAQEKLNEFSKKARAQLAREKDRSLQEAKKELASLVVAATEKVLQERVDEKKDREIVERALREIK